MPIRWCECNVAGEFKVLAGYGIISANLRSNVNFSIGETGVILYGPATGDLSITAYAPLTPADTANLSCPGRAGSQFNWAQFIECENDSSGFIVHYVPNGRNSGYMEGDVTEKISMVSLPGCTNYKTFSISAGSGPSTPSLRFTHRDGYYLTYKNGSPIPIGIESGTNPTVVGFLTSGAEPLLPPGSKLYLNSFSWEYNPPEIPIVSYSFLFSYRACV